MMNTTLNNNTNNTLTYNIKLDNTDNAVKFVKAVNNLEGYFDICMGNYFFDAKSMLGILSMDPRRVMTLQVVRHDDNIEEVNSVLAPFCV